MAIEPKKTPASQESEVGPTVQERPERIPTEEIVRQHVGTRYEVIKPLAFGGMGSVYLAKQLNLDRQVAVKVLTSRDPALVARFRREAAALAAVSHPAIVEIYDFVSRSEAGDGYCFLIMAFIDGMDLADYLKEQPNRRISPDEVLGLMMPIVSALVELHANGIIHRDIKPDNIVRFVRADGRPGVKLVDFGIARRAVDPGMTGTGLILGTPPYMPPEAMLGERHTPLADVYSLGASMYELITGEPPYGRESTQEIMRRTLQEEFELPDGLDGTPLGTLLVEMLDKLARNRPDTMQVLHRLEKIRGALGHQGPGPVNHLAKTRPITLAQEADLVDEAQRQEEGSQEKEIQTEVGVAERSADAERRRIWVRAATLFSIPIVILAVVLAGVLLGEQGSGQGSLKSGPMRAAVKDTMDRPPARDAAAQAMAAPLPDIKVLAEQCTTEQQATDLFNAGREAVKEPDQREYARRVFHALLHSGCATTWMRRWSAYNLSRIYIWRRACPTARIMWKAYQKFTLLEKGPKRRRRRKPKPPKFPGCP